jgi:hypothetical protein
MKKKNPNPLTKIFYYSIILLVAIGLTACASDDEEQSAAPDVLDLNMSIPASLTGAPVPKGVVTVSGVQVRSTDAPCAYQGPGDEDDPFRNGYEMTKFMVSVVASWTCWADALIDISVYVPHNGEIQATDNQTDNVNYEADEPTHYSVTDDSDTQTTIRIYYGYDRDVPPLEGEDPQFYFSWNVDVNGDIQGKLIIDGTAIDPENRKPEDPTMMRMDFNYTATEKLADMFLVFDNGNEWADGFRIEVKKDLTAAPFEHVFTARGLINAKRQFIDVPPISELPVLRMYTVSDRVGEGAAIAEFADVALPLPLNLAGNHLGNYIFDKVDTYFFDADQSTSEPWDYINKTFSFAQYRGNRTTPATGGTLVPFDPSLDQIVDHLGLPNTYFTGNECANVGDNCVDLLNGIFASGFAGQEPNQGTDPGDWRSIALQNPIYLNSIYPNGVDWNGAFDFEFTPVVE